MACRGKQWCIGNHGWKPQNVSTESHIGSHSFPPSSLKFSPHWITLALQILGSFKNRLLSLIRYILWELWKFPSSCSFKRDQETGCSIDLDESYLQPSIHKGDQILSQYQGHTGKSRDYKVDIYPTSNIIFSHDIVKIHPAPPKELPQRQSRISLNFDLNNRRVKLFIHRSSEA